MCVVVYIFFFQAEDGIRDLVRSRGLGDVYKRQSYWHALVPEGLVVVVDPLLRLFGIDKRESERANACLLYTSDAADERSSVDLGGRRIIKKKKHHTIPHGSRIYPPALTKSTHTH